MTYLPDPPPNQMVKRWMFGSIVIYAVNQFHARQAYDQVIKRGLSEAFGTITLEDGTVIRWVDISRKSND